MYKSNGYFLVISKAHFFLCLRSNLSSTGFFHIIFSRQKAIVVRQNKKSTVLLIATYTVEAHDTINPIPIIINKTAATHRDILTGPRQPSGKWPMSFSYLCLRSRKNFRTRQFFHKVFRYIRIVRILAKIQKIAVKQSQTSCSDITERYAPR